MSGASLLQALEGFVPLRQAGISPQSTVRRGVRSDAQAGSLLHVCSQPSWLKARAAHSCQATTNAGRDRLGGSGALSPQFNPVSLKVVVRRGGEELEHPLRDHAEEPETRGEHSVAAALAFVSLCQLLDPAMARAEEDDIILLPPSIPDDTFNQYIVPVLLAAGFVALVIFTLGVGYLTYQEYQEKKDMEDTLKLMEAREGKKSSKSEKTRVTIRKDGPRGFGRAKSEDD